MLLQQSPLYQPGLHIPGIAPHEKFILDEDSIWDILQQNKQFDAAFKTDTRKEIRSFLNFTNLMALAFPAGLITRSVLRKNKRLNKILRFRELTQVRNNIEKGSFAYDTILFNLSPLQVLKNKSHLANLVCLAILFGDEFIDGLAQEYGKANIKRILANQLQRYYLRHKEVNVSVELFYEFDIREIIPDAVLQTVNSKYGINYSEFYGHLQFLLEEMNRQLKKLPADISSEAAGLICTVCNRCFDTYCADINNFNVAYSLNDLLEYYNTKDNRIIKSLLSLRAVLLSKNTLQYQKQFGSWASMVRGMQLYDDMQDADQDCDFQMNFLCYFAFNHFLSEWEWLQENKEKLQQQHGISKYTNISINMPGSVMMCMQYSRYLSNKHLSWVQQKIHNYLWRKNWLGFNNPLLKDDEPPVNTILGSGNAAITATKIALLKQAVFKVSHPFISSEMKWAHLIDIALMDEQLKQDLFNNCSRKEKYCLTSCYIEFPVDAKALVAKAWFEKHFGYSTN